MKIVRNLVLLILGALSVSSCTHNNGDIGDLFGIWVLKSVSIDGLDIKFISDDQNVTWAFQNNIVSVTLLAAHESRLETYGTWEWEDEGKIMHLDFTHIGGFPWGELPFPGEISFNVRVKELNKKNLKFVYVTETGEQMDYVFQKLD